MFDKIPYDIILYIMTFCDMYDIIQLMYASKTLYRFNKYNVIWEYQIKKYFPHSIITNTSFKLSIKGLK